MSISLIRVEAPGGDTNCDRNESEIIPTLPVVLGRGSLLKCGDKKISRRHAYLDWDDDGVMLTSVHQNPTYVITKGDEKELTEGDGVLLIHGDKFGLLKDNFWYKIDLPDSLPENEEKNSVANITENGTSSKDLPDKEGNLSNAIESSPAGSDVSESPCKGKKNDELSKAQIDASSKDSHSDKDTKVNRKLDNVSEKVEKDIISQGQEKENNLPNKLDTNKKKITTEPLQTISAQEIQEAVSTRKRVLPSWLEKIDPSKAKSPAEKSNRNQSHGASRKTQTSTARIKQTKNVPSNSNCDGSSVPQTNNTNVKGKKVPDKAHGISDESDSDSRNQQKVTKVKKTSPKTKKASPSPRKVASPNKKKGSPLKNKTRGLHTMSDDESEDDSGSEIIRNDNVKTQKPEKTPIKQKSPNKHDMSDDDEEEELNLKNKANSTKTKKTKTPTKQKSPRVHDMSDDEEWEDESSENKASNNGNTSTANADASPSVKPTPSPRKKPRNPCRFGANCYRKNPKHLSDFAHVGDADYYEIDSDPEDSNDDRDQCEYGVNCYRKNPQHRKDFRHNRIPQPRRRAKRKALQQKGGDNSDSDDYDYDDPFLNDDSSDDYAPTDSDSDSPMEAEEEEEDNTRRMLKEGKKFIKKR